MADDETIVTLRIEGEDRSGDAVAQAKRRVEELLRLQKDLQQRLEQMDRATVAGDKAKQGSAEEYFKVRKELFQEIPKQLDVAYKAEDMALRKSAQAHQQHAQAVTKAAQQQQAAISAVSGAISHYVRHFISVAAAVEGARESILEFAKVEKAMVNVQLETGATAKQMQHLQHTIEGLARMTGDDFKDLMGQFQAFHAAAGQPIQTTTHLFEQIGKAARAAGVEVNTMAQVASMAMTNLKVPTEEVGEVLDIWVKTIPASMMETWARAGGHITATMRGIGNVGKENAGQIAAAYVAAARALGSTEGAVSSLNKIMTQATNIGTNMGKMFIPLIQNMQGAGKGVMEQQAAMFEQLRGMGAMNPDLAQRSLIQNWIGVNNQDMEALQAVYDQVQKIYNIMRETNESFETVQKRVERQQNTADAAINDLIASFKELKAVVGDLLGGEVIPQQLANIIRALKNDLQTIMDIFKWLRVNVFHTEDTEGNKLTTPEQRLEAARPKQSGWDYLFGGKKPQVEPGKQEGGSFRVAGLGGVDTQPVGFMASPGERVDVTTPMQESLQQQQDKADQAMREHFARFHGTAFTKNVPAAWWPQGGPREPGAEGGRGPSAAGGIPGGSTGGAGPTTTEPGTGTDASGKVSATSATSTAPMGTTPATIPGSVASLGYEPGKFTPVQTLETASGTLGAEGGGKTLAADRARFAEELRNNPALREKVLAIANNEQGGNAQGMQAVIETLMNRASYQGRTLAQEAKWVSEGGYYSDGKKASGMNRPMTEAALTGALGGSNISNYGTDNASTQWGLDRIKRDLYRQTNYINGEYFSSPGKNPAGPGIGNFNKYEAWKARIQAGEKDAPAANKTSAVKTATLTPNAQPNLPAGAFDPNLTKLPSTAGAGAGTDAAVDEALKLEGLHEVRDREKLKEYMKTGGRSLSGEDNAWCARFVNAINVRAGLPGNESWAAKSFLQWGKRVGANEALLKGDVFVKDRGGDKGHVGVFTGKTMKDPKTGETLYEMIQGNVGNRVTRTWERRSGLLSVQRGTPDPTKVATGTTGATQVKTVTVKPTQTAVDTALLSPTSSATNKPASAPTNTKSTTSSPATGDKSSDKAAGKSAAAVKAHSANKDDAGSKAAGKSPGAVQKFAAAGGSDKPGGIGSRQWGGEVRGGRPYMVGESGPELFTPAGPGQITPGIGDFGDALGQFERIAAAMREPIRPQIEMPRAGPIRQRMSRHVEAQRERDVGRMTRHAAHTDIGFA